MRKLSPNLWSGYWLFIVFLVVAVSNGEQRLSRNIVLHIRHPEGRFDKSSADRDLRPHLEAVKPSGIAEEEAPYRQMTERPDIYPLGFRKNIPIENDNRLSERWTRNTPTAHRQSVQRMGLAAVKKDIVDDVRQQSHWRRSRTMRMTRNSDNRSERMLAHHVKNGFLVGLERSSNGREQVAETQHRLANDVQRFHLSFRRSQERLLGQRLSRERRDERRDERLSRERLDERTDLRLSRERRGERLSRERLVNRRDESLSRERRDERRDERVSRERRDERRDERVSRERRDERRDERVSRERLGDRRDESLSRERRDEQRDKRISRERLGDRRDGRLSKERRDERRDEHLSRQHVDERTDLRLSRERLGDRRDESLSRERRDERRDERILRERLGNRRDERLSKERRDERIGERLSNERRDERISRERLDDRRDLRPSSERREEPRGERKDEPRVESSSTSLLLIRNAPSRQTSQRQIFPNEQLTNDQRRNEVRLLEHSKLASLNRELQNVRSRQRIVGERILGQQRRDTALAVRQQRSHGHFTKKSREVRSVERRVAIIQRENGWPLDRSVQTDPLNSSRRQVRSRSQRQRSREGDTMNEGRYVPAERTAYLHRRDEQSRRHGETFLQRGSVYGDAPFRTRRENSLAPTLNSERRDQRFRGHRERSAEHILNSNRRDIERERFSEEHLQQDEPRISRSRQQRESLSKHFRSEARREMALEHSRSNRLNDNRQTTEGLFVLLSNKYMVREDFHSNPAGTEREVRQHRLLLSRVQTDGREQLRSSGRLILLKNSPTSSWKLPKLLSSGDLYSVSDFIRKQTAINSKPVIGEMNLKYRREYQLASPLVADMKEDFSGKNSPSNWLTTFSLGALTLLTVTMQQSSKSVKLF